MGIFLEHTIGVCSPREECCVVCFPFDEAALSKLKLGHLCPIPCAVPDILGRTNTRIFIVLCCLLSPPRINTRSLTAFTQG